MAQVKHRCYLTLMISKKFYKPFPPAKKPSLLPQKLHNIYEPLAPKVTSSIKHYIRNCFSGRIRLC